MAVDPDLIAQWTRDAAEPFEGWDFSFLKDRMVDTDPPWSYPELARIAIAGAQDILDVATGGGEMLASLAPFPGRVRAVEGYAPNVPVARRRLAPLGIEVFEGHTETGMPFADDSFDLVLNRHGGFRAAEMHRILQPGGTFLSQQVGGDNLGDLRAVFGAPMQYPENTLERVGDAFAILGCEIRRRETWHGPVTFGDVGALVYFLKATPWVVKDFDVVKHAEALATLQHDLEAGKPLCFTYSRFLIDVEKQ